jgi:hypothetical protein
VLAPAIARGVRSRVVASCPGAPAVVGRPRACPTTRRAGLLVAAILSTVELTLGLGVAHAEVVLAIGDSITAGVTRSSPGHPAETDSRGGYPKRLEALLGGDVRVVARGAPGYGTEFWLGHAHADV